MKNVIAAFADRAGADRACRDVRQAIHLRHEPMLVTDHDGDVRRELSSRNVGSDLADRYAEASSRGAVVVVCEVENQEAERAAEILEGDGALDLEHEAAAAPIGDQDRMRERQTVGKQSIPVVQEEVKVGKREVPGQEAHVRTMVSERPVRKDVTLEDERVDVRREPADEPLSSSEAESAFAKGEHVVETKAEEPVVEKQAHVVGRVEVSKQPEPRTETIEATERRSDVAVDKEPPRR